MTFLELCQTARMECGIAGNAAGLSPVSVIGQVGELLRVINWVKQAYEDIQLKHGQWAFLRHPFSVGTVAGQAFYQPSTLLIQDYGDLKKDSLRIYQGSVDNEQWLPYCEWGEFRDSRLLGASASQQGRPMEFTVKPDRSLQVWPVPDQVYTITGEYFRSPHVMVDNADVPVFDRHHMAVVWNAVMRYAAWSGEPSLYAHAQKEYGRLINKLEILYLPELTMGGALA